MKNLTYIFAATLFMVACNNEGLVSPQDGENVIIKFNSNLNDYDSQVVSRLGETSFDENDQVALWANVSEGVAPFTGREILNAGTDGSLSSDKVLTYQDDNIVFFSALYPASLCTDNSKPMNITLNVESDGNGYQSLPDLIYATATGSAADPNVNFMFNRQLAKVCVAVKNEGVDLEGAEVFVKAKSGGEFNLTDVSVTVPADAQVQDYKIPLVTVDDFNQNTNYGSTIVAPQTLEGECIGIKLKDQETKYVSFPSIVLDRAKKYIFNITTKKINEGDVEISIATEINEEPWISDEATDGEVEVDDVQILNKCLKLTGGNEQTQAFYTLSSPLPVGTYTFTCKVKSTVAISGGNVVLQNASTWDNQLPKWGAFQSTTEWTNLTVNDITITQEKEGYYTRFFIQFNANPEDYVLIDNMSLTLSGDTKNYIENSDFSDGTTTGWSSYGNNVSLGEY